MRHPRPRRSRGRSYRQNDQGLDTSPSPTGLRRVSRTASRPPRPTLADAAVQRTARCCAQDVHASPAACMWWRCTHPTCPRLSVWRWAAARGTNRPPCRAWGTWWHRCSPGQPTPRRHGGGQPGLRGDGRQSRRGHLARSLNALGHRSALRQATARPCARPPLAPAPGHRFGGPGRHRRRSPPSQRIETGRGHSRPRYLSDWTGAERLAGLGVEDEQGDGSRRYLDDIVGASLCPHRRNGGCALADIGIGEGGAVESHLGACKSRLAVLVGQKE